MKVTCPECYFIFEVNDVMLGEIIECSDCGTELEVIEIDDKEQEVIVQKAETEEEDWGE
ncbi:MAG: lysine biosynthesis protein LysW [Candidatus Helarchaeota archaeon]